MIIHNDIEQNSPEWKALRAGIPTASAFDKIITASGKSSDQAEKYMEILVSEIMTGVPIEEGYKSRSMKRGHELEDKAADFYSIERGVDVLKVGFITDDLRMMGCSPDRLVGDDGMLEIKCPDQQTMISYYRMDDDKLKKEYWVQKQGQLLVAQRKWVDNLFYAESPLQPALIVRVVRDEMFLGKMRVHLKEFFEGMNKIKQHLVDRGFSLPAHATDPEHINPLAG